MEKKNLLFFESICHSNIDGDPSSVKCSIEHKHKKFKKGDYIAYQGDKVLSLPMLIKGKVRTEIVSDSGFVLPMESIAAPYPLAAAFLFADDNTFPVDVIAIEDSELILIPKSAIEKQMATCPIFLRGFLAFNSNRMHFMSERLKIFAQKGIKAKFAYHIISNEKKRRFKLNKSITYLANYFGVERPSLSRAIGEMVKEGIITYEQGGGEILDFTRLSDFLS